MVSPSSHGMSYSNKNAPHSRACRCTPRAGTERKVGETESTQRHRLVRDKEQRDESTSPVPELCASSIQGAAQFTEISKAQKNKIC